MSTIAIKPRSGSCHCKVNQSDSYEISKSELTGGNKQFKMYDISERELGTHRCQPLRFFRNCYEFRAKITVLRSTVYLLRISDYCQPETVPHLNIIVII